MSFYEVLHDTRSNSKDICILVQLANHKRYEFIKKRIKQLNQTPYSYDVYINLCKSIYDQDELNGMQDQIKSDFTHVTVTLTENKGADLGQFFAQVDYILKQERNYKYLIKLHSKTNIFWMNQLVNSLLETPEKIMENIDLFNKYKQIGMIGHARWIYPIMHKMYNNKRFTDYTRHLCSKYGLGIRDKGKKHIDQAWNTVTVTSDNVHWYVALNPELASYGRKKPEHFIDHFNTKGRSDYRVPHPNFANHYFKDIDTFVAGTMFMCRFDIISNFFSKINIAEAYQQFESGYYEYGRISLCAHSWERMLGIMVSRQLVGCGKETMRVWGVI